ncbi:MAG: glycosyltransferase [Desulfobacteraceae bacterium]|nr:glycosyltransferase [Desulfobacteraceae bacterium]
MNITVVIPTHNRPGDLREALDSVFAQSRLPEEIIVIDDGSYPPVSREVLKGCPSGTKAVLLRNDRPLGANSARNMGVRQASGLWIAFLDDDDRFKTEKIESVVRTIKEDPDADLIYHPAQICMVKEKVTYFSKPRAIGKDTDIFRELLIKNIIGGSSMTTVRRELLMEAGLFDTQLPALQDYELWLRLAKMGCRYQYISSPLTVYQCITGKNSTSKSIEANRRALEIIEARYESSYKSLAPNELKQHEAWKKRMIIHKALLNGRPAIALKEQLKQLAANPRPGHLLGLIAIFMGAKMTYRLRSWRNIN